jgi:hypothetical protein
LIEQVSLSAGNLYKPWFTVDIAFAYMLLTAR